MNKKYLLILCIIILYYLFYKYSTKLEFFTVDSKNPGPTLFLIGGTHGNEPAGSVGLNHIINEIKNGKIKIKYGKIIILAKANKSGLFFNSRFMLHNLFNGDLNRNYPINKNEKPRDYISKKITKIVDQADWIIDFHEGWGYARVNKKSMGSGIYPGKFEESINIANLLVKNINKQISNPKKKFIVLTGVHPNLNTLKNYAALQNKKYILIETTGQNNIQPLKVRKNQVINIVYNFLNITKQGEIMSYS
jgi:hypothetical protein